MKIRVLPGVDLTVAIKTMILFARITGEDIELDFSGTVVKIDCLDMYHGVAARWHTARAKEQIERLL